MWAARGYLNDDYPDGSEVDIPRDSGEPLLWSTEEPGNGLVRIRLADWVTPRAPEVWFVFVDEPKAKPPAANLVAFANGARPPGTVVSHYQFATMGVRNDEQVGAVRWYRDRALVHQVYVAKRWRRQQLATHLLYTAGIFHLANRWPGNMHGDGRRTQLGDRLVAAIRHPGRYKPLTELQPPMDPS